MRKLLAPDLIAWVTNADGEADRVTGGHEESPARIAAMDLPAAQYRVTLTQSPAAIGHHLLLLDAVEVQAERATAGWAGNFAAPAATRLRVDDGRVTQWRMADAKRPKVIGSGSLRGPDLAGVDIKPHERLRAGDHQSELEAASDSI